MEHDLICSAREYDIEYKCGVIFLSSHKHYVEEVSFEFLLRVHSCLGGH